MQLPKGTQTSWHLLLLLLALWQLASRCWGGWVAGRGCSRGCMRVLLWLW